MRRAGDLAALQQQARAFAALQLAEKAAAGSAPSTPSPQVCHLVKSSMHFRILFRWIGGGEKMRNGVVEPAEVSPTTKSPPPTIETERATTRLEELSEGVTREDVVEKVEEEEEVVRGETLDLMIGRVDWLESICTGYNAVLFFNENYPWRHLYFCFATSIFRDDRRQLFQAKVEEEQRQKVLRASLSARHTQCCR